MAERRKRVHRPRIQYDGRSLVESHGFHTPLRGIIHETISHNVPGTADLSGVANFWHNQELGYGAHYGIDDEGNSAIYVNPREIAYHTQARNTGSIGIEEVSMKWLDKVKWWLGASKQMHKTAKWMAYLNKEYSIPLRWDVNHGWSTHYMQTKAFNLPSGHTDGQFLPKRRLMRLARKYRREGW